MVSRSGDQTQEPRSVINWTLTLALQDSESGSVTLLFNTVELSPHTATKNPPVASGHTPAQIPAPGCGAWGAARPGPVLSASSPAHCPPPPPGTLQPSLLLLPTQGLCTISFAWDARTPDPQRASSCWPIRSQLKCHPSERSPQTCNQSSCHPILRYILAFFLCILYPYLEES